MSSEFVATDIVVSDVEELNGAVSPWDLRMRQVSPGSLTATLNAVQVKGILLSDERWSRAVLATGATPPGFVALAGSLSAIAPFDWCGESIERNSGRIVCAFDATDTSFLTRPGSHHWVILVPIDRLTKHLGEEMVTGLSRGRRFLQCDPGVSNRLAALVIRTIRGIAGLDPLRTDNTILDVIESQLLEAISEVVCLTASSGACSTSRQRYLAVRRAVDYAEKLKRRIRVPELAREAGVSPRVLELAFHESLGVSPTRFLRWVRLNGLHRELRVIQKGTSRISDVATRWGFSELGRTSVEYRRFFGESPSATLAADYGSRGTRFADLLAESRAH